MKKILATLLVATMIMSCMTFISFAANEGVVYTLENFADMDLANKKSGKVYIFTDSFTSAYYDKAMETFADSYADIETDSDYNWKYDSNILTELDWILSGYEDYTLKVSANDYVAFPIYASQVMQGINVDVKFDTALFTYDSFATDFNGKANDKTNYETDAEGLVSVGIMDNPTDLMGIVFLKVNADAKDEDGFATITAEITDATVKADSSKVTGTLTMNVALDVEKGEQKVDITAEDLAEVVTHKALSEDADAAGLADALANYSGVEVPSDVATNKYVYNAIFATIPTEGYNTPSEYGVILHTAAGDQKAPAKITANGKFGIFVYGSSYALDGIESYQLYCVVNGETVLGEVVAY